jgi:transposase
LMANEFWLSEASWAVIEPLIPMNRRGVKPSNNYRIISGIVHVLRCGCRWRDCPEVFGPPTTIYNRFNRWSQAGIWQSLWDRLIQFDAAKVQSIDSTSSKADRCAAGGDGGEARPDIGRSRGGRTTKVHAVVDARGRMIAFDLTPGQRGDIRPAKAVLEPLPPPDFLLADTAYDGDQFRNFLAKRGTTPVIRPNPTRKNIPEFDKDRYKARNVVERAFCRIKDWRRVATRYDKLARNFRAAVILAAIFIWWT